MTDPDASIGAPVEAFIRLIRGRHKPDIVIRLGKGRQRVGSVAGSVTDQLVSYRYRRPLLCAPRLPSKLSAS